MRPRKNTKKENELPKAASAGETAEEVQEESQGNEATTEGKVAIKKRHKKKEHIPVPQKSLCSKVWNIGKYIILVAVIPGILNFAALQKEARELKPAGELYDVGFGQKLYMNCEGDGLPTVILDAPTGMSSDVWLAIQKELSKVTRVCVYDRAGLGFSDRPPYNSSSSSSSYQKDAMGLSGRESTTERMVDDLHRLVTFADPQPRPLLLVGSELGAVNVRFFAHMFPKDVSSVVLLDPITETLFVEDGGIWNRYWYEHLVPSFEMLQFSAAVGLSRLAIIMGLLEHPLSGTTLSADVINRQKYLMSHPRHLSSVVDEHYFANESLAQLNFARRLIDFPENVSVTVITGDYHDEQLPSDLNQVWAKAQQRLTSEVYRGCKRIVVNGADHTMLYRQPQAVCDPIKRLIKKWRTPKRKMMITKSI